MKNHVGTYDHFFVDSVDGGARLQYYEQHLGERQSGLRDNPRCLGSIFRSKIAVKPALGCLHGGGGRKTNASDSSEDCRRC
jgi:hypothetical protein